MPKKPAPGAKCSGEFRGVRKSRPVSRNPGHDTEKKTGLQPIIEHGAMGEPQSRLLPLGEKPLSGPGIPICCPIRAGSIKNWKKPYEWSFLKHRIKDLGEIVRKRNYGNRGYWDAA